MFQALKIAQTELSEYKLDNKELKVENATLSTAIPKKVRRARLKGYPAEFLEEAAAIENIARMFTIVATPWTVKDDFTAPCPVGLDPSKPERYANNATAKLGVTAELYRYVPLHLQDMMRTTDFFTIAVSSPYLRKLTPVSHFHVVSKRCQVSAFKHDTPLPYSCPWDYEPWQDN